MFIVLLAAVEVAVALAVPVDVRYLDTAASTAMTSRSASVARYQSQYGVAAVRDVVVVVVVFAPHPSLSAFPTISRRHSLCSRSHRCRRRSCPFQCCLWLMLLIDSFLQ